MHHARICIRIERMRRRQPDHQEPMILHRIIAQNFDVAHTHWLNLGSFEILYKALLSQRAL